MFVQSWSRCLERWREGESDEGVGTGGIRGQEMNRDKGEPALKFLSCNQEGAREIIIGRGKLRIRTRTEKKGESISRNIRRLSGNG